MIETLLGSGCTTSSLGSLGALAATVTIIVEVLKQVVPKSFPTKLLTIIVSLVVCIFSVILCYDISFRTIVSGIFISFVTSFISMNGFDTFKDIWLRYSKRGDN